MGARVMFLGVARASTNPKFVALCTDLINPERWQGVGPITLGFYPHNNFTSLHAQFVWRNEAFAYAFPSAEDDNKIIVGEKDEDDSWCPQLPEEAFKRLAIMLDEYLVERIKRRRAWIRTAKASLDNLGKIITFT